MKTMEKEAGQMLRRKALFKGILLLLIMPFVSNVVFADLQIILQNRLPFVDVPEGAWYYADVKLAYQSGLMNGKTATLFAPEEDMTTAEAVKLAACMHQLKNEGAVSLSAGTGIWYQPYVDYAKDKEIVVVDLDWSQKITRAGFMEIFARLISEEETLLNDVPDGFIPDVEMTHPSAEAIYKLYRAGVVQGSDAERNCKPFGYIKRSEIASILTRMMRESSRIVFMPGQNLIIRVQPQNAEGRPGNKVRLEVTVGGGKAPLSYQWEYFDEIDGAFKKSTAEGNTTDQLIALVEEKTWKYRCVIRDAVGKEIISDTVKVEKSTTEELKITKQPEPRSGKVGEIVKLEVEVSGAKAPVIYQWEYSENPNGPFYKSEAVGNHTNELTVAIEEKPYYYRCHIRDREEKSIRSATVLVQKRTENGQ